MARPALEVNWLTSTDVLDPLDRKALAKIVEAFERAGELRPDHVLLDKDKSAPFSVESLAKGLKESGDRVSVFFSPSAIKCSMSLQSLHGMPKLGFQLEMGIALDFFLDEKRAQSRADALVDLLRAVAEVSPPVYGWAHPLDDRMLGGDPHATSVRAAKEVYEAYWLTALGGDLVKKLGRKRVMATPAYRVDELPGGGALILTRPTPADATSPEAREAQARALAHLKPEASYEQALARLRERSEKLAPVERKWDPDLAPLFERVLERTPLDRKREVALALNRPRPPPSEWRSSSEQAKPDVDAARETSRYHDLAEQTVMGLHTSISDLLDGEPPSLAELDRFLWLQNYPRTSKPEKIDGLVERIGAYLGQTMVRHLKGKWSPRKNVDEAAVVVGDRAWLPFLRVRHALASQEAMLDHSLHQFFRVAERHARGGR